VPDTNRVAFWRIAGALSLPMSLVERRHRWLLKDVLSLWNELLVGVAVVFRSVTASDNTCQFLQNCTACFSVLRSVPALAAVCLFCSVNTKQSSRRWPVLRRAWRQTVLSPVCLLQASLLRMNLMMLMMAMTMTSKRGFVDRTPANSS